MEASHLVWQMISSKDSKGLKRNNQIYTRNLETVQDIHSPENDEIDYMDKLVM